MPFHYVKVVLTDENARAQGRRTLYLEARKPFGAGALVGLLVDREGAAIETPAVGEHGEKGYARELVALERADCKRVLPQRMNLHYGQLEDDPDAR